MPEPTSPRTLTDVYRPLRLLGPDESPVAGTLIAEGDHRGVLVRSEDLDEACWRAAGSEHLLGASTMVRLEDGHGVLLPWCRQRVLRWLAERERSGAPPSGGEQVTLLVSVLRGLREADVHWPVAQTGSWWLDDAQRPRFVPGPGEGIVEATERVVDALAERSEHRLLDRRLQEVRALIGHPGRLRREGDRVEAELFETFAAQPLKEPPSLPLVAHGAERLAVEALRERPGLVDHLLPLIDASFADQLRALCRDAHTRFGEFWRRRRPLVVGAVAFVIVLAGGSMWGAASPAAGEPAAPAASAEPTPTRDTVTQTPNAAQEARAMRRAPRGEEGAVHAARRLVPETAGARFDLWEDFGDVAVVRAQSPDGVARHVILERDGRSWKLRDVVTTTGAD